LRLGLALATLVTLARAHVAGGPVDRRSLSVKIGASENRLGEVLRTLHQADLVAIDESGGLLPARDPRSMRLSVVVQALGHGVPRMPPNAGWHGDDWGPMARDALVQAAQAEDGTLAITVQDLAEANDQARSTKEREMDA
jgi:DNA-binding IscR family transcriptional regulator